MQDVHVQVANYKLAAEFTEADDRHVLFCLVARVNHNGGERCSIVTNVNGIARADVFAIPIKKRGVVIFHTPFVFFSACPASASTPELPIHWIRGLGAIVTVASAIALWRVRIVQVSQHLRLDLRERGIRLGLRDTIRLHRRLKRRRAYRDKLGRDLVERHTLGLCNTGNGLASVQFCDQRIHIHPQHFRRYRDERFLRSTQPAPVQSERASNTWVSRCGALRERARYTDCHYRDQRDSHCKRS